MASFPSQLPSKDLDFPTTSSTTILIGSSNWATFVRDIKTHFSTNFGQIGSDIVNNTDTEFAEAGPPPDYNDPRIHPSTGEPIPNSRRYQQRAMTQDETDDRTFDRETLELTPESEKKLDHDISHWQAKATRCDQKHALLKKHDDDALNYVLQHMSPLCKETVKTHPDMADFKALPFSCVTRTGDYLHILEHQYSRGNSTTIINEVSKLFDMVELPTDTPATFINKVQEQLQSVMPLIESKDYEGHVEISKIFAMILIKGFSRLNAATINALRIHMQTYPGATSLDHSEELITEVLAMQDSDLATLGTTQVIHSSPEEETSAYSAISLTNKPRLGAHQSGKIHCTNCFGLTNKYFYGHAASQCTRTHTVKPANPAGTKPTPSTQANVAGIESTMTTNTAFDFLQSQGYSFEDQPTTVGAHLAGIQPMLTTEQAFEFLHSQGYSFGEAP